MDLRVGHGRDTHRLSRGRKLILGGVPIDFERGLIGHSDADVLLHAITDALFGAAGLGDIGEWFSDRDPQWAGADSAALLKSALREVRGRNWKIVNLDCTISAEQPRLSSHKATIRGRIAELLELPAENVNVKAKTGEGVGPVGRGEVIEADAVVLLAQRFIRSGNEMSLRVYNTLTRQKEDFQTIVPGQVRMYLCGPTVYKPAHIGHMVGPVIFDTVKRYLNYNGYQVKFVINITDVDDKLINRARENKTTVEALAKQMTQDYFDNLASVGVDTVDEFPYATAHITGMQKIIGRLIEKGFAYPLDGDVYFEVTKDPDYGKLSHRSVEEMLAGTRVEANDRKHNPADFALWKKSKPGEPAWDSPWGQGRPGWHIECSAMSMELLGDSIDIHGGGLDLMFPHHENELAQSESCTGKPFSRYWLHNGLMQSGPVAGKVGGGHDRHGDISQAEQEANKLAGSKGAASVKQLFAVFPPETVRFFLLSTHYRSPIELSDAQIAQKGESLDRFYRLFGAFNRITGSDFYALAAPTSRKSSTRLEGQPPELFQELSQLRERFLTAMDDDFNTGGAIGVLFDLSRAINGFIGQKKLDSGGAADDLAKAALVTAMTLLKELSGVLGLFRKPIAKPSQGGDELTDKLMKLMIELRAESRRTKNFAIADKIRDGLTALKITLEDRPDGTNWRRDG